MASLLLMMFFVSVAFSEQQCACTEGALDESFKSAREVFIGVILDHKSRVLDVGVRESLKGFLVRNQRVQITYTCSFFPVPSNNVSLFFTTVPIFPKSVATVSLVPCTKNGAYTSAELRYIRTQPVTCNVSTLPSPPKVTPSSTQLSEGTVVQVACGNTCTCTHGYFKCTSLSCSRFPCGTHKDGETWSVDCKTYYCNNSVTQTISTSSSCSSPTLSSPIVILVTVSLACVLLLTCFAGLVRWWRRGRKEEWDDGEEGDEEVDDGYPPLELSSASSSSCEDHVTRTNIISTMNNSINGNAYNNVYTIATPGGPIQFLPPAFSGYPVQQQTVFVPMQHQTQQIPVYVMTQPGLVNSNQVTYM